MTESEFVKQNIKLARSFAFNSLPYTSGTILSQNDLVQEGLIGLLKAFRTYKPGRETVDRFCQIRMKYAMYDAIEAQKIRTPENGFFSTYDIHDYSVLDGRSKDHEIDRDKLINQIKQSIDNLPKAQGRVMKMLYLDDMKADEIADKLGVQRNTVYVLQSNALKRLRSIYGKRNN